jgi:hypothetical protein
MVAVLRQPMMDQVQEQAQRRCQLMAVAAVTY